MQSLPSIRLVQENDKSLITKINSTLVNTVPLWETQLAQALTIQRTADAADVELLAAITKMRKDGDLIALRDINQDEQLMMDYDDSFGEVHTFGPGADD